MTERPSLRCALLASKLGLTSIFLFALDEFSQLVLDSTFDPTSAAAQVR